MNTEEKNEIIDEVKRQVTMEMAPEYQKYLAKQSEVMCRVFSALDYLESNLDDYYKSIQSYFGSDENGKSMCL